MIVRALLSIKHRLPVLWRLVDWVNARLYGLLHRQRMAVEVARAFADFRLEGFEFAPLVADDLAALEAMLERQGAARLRYFQPHGFDHRSLVRMFSNPAFLMFGAFRDEELVGYFFLRCFWNRKCFVGRLIDEPHEGQGVGRVMNQIMYNLAWRSGFRCMTTISRENQFIMRSHLNNPHARVLGSLANEYVLVEFVPEASAEDRAGLAG